MNTAKPSSSQLESGLKAIPTEYRSRILDHYHAIKKRFRQSQLSASYDSAGMSAGKFSEAILRYLQFSLTGSSIPFGQHISNFADECQKLISLPRTVGLETTRVVIPRALVFLNTMRGKRGIGHVGGDVEANAIDLATIVRVCDWILAELVRVNHGLSLEDAQAIVDSLATKEVPDIWEVAGKKRVLVPGMSHKQKVLLLLYSQPQSSALAEDLFVWTEHTHMPVFRRDVLRPLHVERLIEYDEDQEIVYLSPSGIDEVERKLLAARASTSLT